MKRTLFSLLLICALALGIFPMQRLTACAYSETNIVYAVEGGNLYFDPNTGTITDCDSTVTMAQIPTAINGVAVTAIGNFAFESCAKMKTVTIPQGVVSIGQLSFAYCHALTGITLPNSVTTLRDKAFFDCISLSDINLGSGITSIGRDVFWGTAYYRADKNWKNDFLYSGNCLIAAKTTISGIYTLPENTKVIAGSAFYACTGLTGIILPDSLISIGDESFYYCTQLTSVRIPDSVITLGVSAFRHCAALTELEIGNGVRTIRENAFSHCGKLTSVTMGRSVDSIETLAFSDCASLTEICFWGDAPTLGEHPFDRYNYTAGGYTPIEGLTLYYREGTSGWESPLWNGYPTDTWKPVVKFDDVSDTAWYAAAVEYTVSNGLMNGTGIGSFEPESPMTRAMLVTVLWRYEGEPSGYVNVFTDIKDGQWYTQAVAWAVANGIVSGIGNGRFDPDGRITREQLATILFRYCNSKGINTAARADLSSFPDDGRVSAYASDAMSWAVAIDLVNGTQIGSSTHLDPHGNATRAQVATILMRLIENITQ